MLMRRRLGSAETDIAAVRRGLVTLQLGAVLRHRAGSAGPGRMPMTAWTAARQLWICSERKRRREPTDLP